MRKIHLILAISALFCAQNTLAMMHDDDEMSSNSRPCAAIVKACLHAGYTREHHKNFWLECMKPVVMGKHVANVNIDAATAKECRKDKIMKMKKELKELQERMNS